MDGRFTWDGPGAPLYSGILYPGRDVCGQLFYKSTKLVEYGFSVEDSSEEVPRKYKLVPRNVKLKRKQLREENTSDSGEEAGEKRST